MQAASMERSQNHSLSMGLTERDKSTKVLAEHIIHSHDRYDYCIQYAEITLLLYIAICFTNLIIIINAGLPFHDIIN